MEDLRISSSEAVGRRDRPVFVSAGNRRRRALRALGYVAGALTVLWVVALIAGAVGAERLPAVPFPAIGALGEASGVADDRQPAVTRPAARHSATDGRAAGPSADARAPRAHAPSVPGGGADRRGPVGGGPQPVRARPEGSPSQPAPAPAPPPGTSPPSGTAPRQAGTTPTSPPARGGGSGARFDEAPTNGRSEAPPASRPVDPTLSPPGAAHRPSTS
jgi:hypothetical protein